MRVGVNALFLIPGQVGGTEGYLRDLLPGLATAGVDLLLYTNRENHDTFEDWGRLLIDVPATSRAARLVAEQTRLVKAVRSSGVDVLYSPGYVGPLYPGRPHVVVVHDTQFLDMPQGFPLAWRLGHRMLVGGAVKRSQAVVAVSEFSRQRIIEHYRVPEERVFVAGSGCIGAFAAPRPCPVDGPFLLYVANTYPHKNAPRLVRAFARIAGDIPHSLVIVGRPRQGEPPPHPRVKRLKRVTQDELAGLYHGCDLVVHPSLYEGFGRPLIEAQEAGARIVASDAAAIPEVAGDGATYFDATSEETIAGAIADALNEPPEARAGHIERARRNAARYTVQACAQSTLEALTHAIG